MPAAATLVRNGDFEAGAEGWTIDGPARLNDAYPYWGVSAASLCALPDRGGRIWQEVVAPETGSYVLTAYVATNIRAGNVPAGASGDVVSVGVDVDGAFVRASGGVPAFAGYQRQTVEFTANAGSRIRVWFRTPPSAPLPYFGITPAASQPPAYAVVDGVSLVRKGP